MNIAYNQIKINQLIVYTGDRAISSSNMQMTDSTSINSNISGSGGLGGGGDNMLTNDLHQLRIEMVNTVI